MGPQHPSTHGVFRMVVTLNGETIVDLEPVMGYLHRNHEKIGERNTWLGNMPFTDRLDYISSMHNNFGYAVAVEKLMGVEVPERAEYIRVIMAEFTRIVNHFIAIGFLFNDLGAFFTPALYGLEERELILDLFEMASGSRMMCNYFRFGGVARDLPEEFLPLARELVENRLPRVIDEFETYLTGNEIFLARSVGVGVLPKEMAIAYSTAGPVLRASGVAYDVRKAEPYGIYDRFDFEIPVGTNGDIFDRYKVRIEEMRQSLRILKQALDQIPEGPIQAGKKAYQVRVPAGDAYGRVENPKGELGFYLVSTGGPNPYRYHIRAPSFINLTSLGEMCKGHKVADIVVILGSIDIVLGEVDR
ncbi:MAG: NADH-quinone oxidoreductase subunit D [Chloroflexi bacterium]|nr:MAG: NADH-quinone oxidoreductase subunit D [Chloroflexota bacterium]